MAATEQVPAPPAGTPVGHQGVRVDVHERQTLQINGFLGLLLALLLLSAAIVAFNRLLVTQVGSWAVLGSFLLALAIVVLASIKVIQPGQTAVVQFFGRYIGTARRTGLVWLT